MNQLLLRRRADAVSEKKEYAVQCFNPNVENYNPAVSIILDAAGYGKYVDSNDHSKGWYLIKKEASAITSIGTLFRGKTNVTDTNGIVSDDTSLVYTFSSFNELKYFTGITALQTSCFSGCTNLQGTFIFNSNITSFGTNILDGCRAITNVSVKGNCLLTQYTFKNSGNQSGTLEFYSMRNQENYQNYMYYKKILVRQNLDITARNMPLFNGVEGMQEIRVYGNLLFNDGNATVNNVVVDSNKGYLKFFEIYGVCTSTSTNTGIVRYYNAFSSNAILHLGNSSIAGSVSVFRASFSTISKIYVGKGDSLQNDVNIFNTYFADTNWSTYCGNGTPGNGKVDLWWNYNGQYRTYQVQENLTNFTNSNPVEWPYITRNESYNTTIVPTGDTPLNRVMVLMYEAVDDGATPDNPTDITSQVYNPSTGEINIPHVTGNVIIEEFNEIKLHPTSLDSSRTLYAGNGYPARAYSNVYKYADDSSSGDYRINNSQGSNAYITYFIDCSIIPRNVTILSVECAYNAKIDGNCSSTTKLMCGNIVKSEESATPTTGGITVMNDAGIWNRNELDSCAIMFSVNPNNLQQIKYMWLHGATLTVKYK